MCDMTEDDLPVLPGFRELAQRRQGLLADLIERRHRAGLSQAELARRLRAPNAKADLDALTQRVVSRGLDPRSAALELLHRLSQ